MLFFFFNDTATTEIYTLSLHDALPILNLPAPNDLPTVEVPQPAAAANDALLAPEAAPCRRSGVGALNRVPCGPADRKSTRLNSSHANISYAVFCLKKKKKT